VDQRGHAPDYMASHGNFSCNINFTYLEFAALFLSASRKQGSFATLSSGGTSQPQCKRVTVGCGRQSAVCSAQGGRLNTSSHVEAQGAVCSAQGGRLKHLITRGGAGRCCQSLDASVSMNPFTTIPPARNWGQVGIRKSCRSNLGSSTAYTDRGFLTLYLEKWWNNAFRQATITSFHILSNS
jgi:hypothetical protein